MHRRRPKCDDPKTPASKPHYPLRESMATIEGRWAEGIQSRIDKARSQEDGHTAATMHKSQGPSNQTRSDPIVAAARNGAILPFSEHPAITDPLDSVWKKPKKFTMDPSKTSAGLTQDLIKWSKISIGVEKISK